MTNVSMLRFYDDVMTANIVQNSKKFYDADIFKLRKCYFLEKNFLAL